MGCGMLILDDQILNKVRQHMIRNGFSDDAIKPAGLVQSLLTMAREGKLVRPSAKDTVTGCISSCMERDIGMGLDDFFDDRASNSIEDMRKWEETWTQTTAQEEEAQEASEGADAVDSAIHKESSDEIDDQNASPMPLLVFIRTGASNSLLKSKSAMELLIKECTSPDSIHLITLGKGVDASTTTLPKEEEPVPSTDVGSAGNNMDMSSNSNMPKGLPGQPSFHGFSNQNQNASGQFDPKGSRRFNFFLARTIDHNGQPGLLGAIAPPQAGDMFPHMMAMQARERLQSEDPDSPAKAELERWAEMLQTNMQGSADVPAPQFFNATLVHSDASNQGGGMNPQYPPPEVIEQTLQAAMAELIDRFAQMAEDEEQAAPGKELSPDLYKAFGQVVRNDQLRKGIADNLNQAARALSDPKCHGVMLSVYVPPPNQQITGSLPPPSQQQSQGNKSQISNGMNNWFQKILHHQEEEGNDDPEQRKQKRVRTMAAAAAMFASKNKDSN